MTELFVCPSHPGHKQSVCLVGFLDPLQVQIHNDVTFQTHEVVVTAPHLWIHPDRSWSPWPEFISAAFVTTLFRNLVASQSTLSKSRTCSFLPQPPPPLPHAWHDTALLASLSCEYLGALWRLPQSPTTAQSLPTGPFLRIRARDTEISKHDPKIFFISMLISFFYMILLGGDSGPH